MLPVSLRACVIPHHTRVHITQASLRWHSTQSTCVRVFTGHGPQYAHALVDAMLPHARADDPVPSLQAEPATACAHTPRFGVRSHAPSCEAHPRASHLSRGAPAPLLLPRVRATVCSHAPAAGALPPLRNLGRRRRGVDLLLRIGEVCHVQDVIGREHARKLLV